LLTADFLIGLVANSPMDLKDKLEWHKKLFAKDFQTEVWVRIWSNLIMAAELGKDLDEPFTDDQAASLITGKPNATARDLILTFHLEAFTNGVVTRKPKEPKEPNVTQDI
jgi:hypothetical protein